MLHMTLVPILVVRDNGLEGSEIYDWRILGGSNHVQQYAMDAIAAASGATGRLAIRQQPFLGAPVVHVFRHFIACASTECLIPGSRLRIVPTHDGILASLREVAAGREKFAAVVPSARVLSLAWNSFNDNGLSPAGSVEDLRAAEVLYLAVLRQGAAVMHLKGMAAVRQRRAIRRIRRGGFPLVTSQPVNRVVTINEHTC